MAVERSNVSSDLIWKLTRMFSFWFPPKILHEPYTQLAKSRNAQFGRFRFYQQFIQYVVLIAGIGKSWGLWLIQYKFFGGE